MMLGVFNQLDAATTPSQVAADILDHQDIRFPVHVISNGVDIERFLPYPKVDRQEIRSKYGLAHDRTLFLYVGRLDGEKRVDILLQAVSKLPHANLQLAIAGDGLQAQALRNQAHHLGLEGRVVFLGYVPAADLPALYASVDIFVMPSPEELQSIATLEAIACGKPILATNARALPELVTHEVNGYLFQPGNANDAAHWMNKFLAIPEQWAQMGQAGLTRSQSHSLNNTIQAYEERYRLVIEEQAATQKSPKRMKMPDVYHTKKIVKP
jgi:glycosyltransferase involved in cell wall biosynthesis